MIGYFNLPFLAPLDVTCEPGFYRLRNAITTDDGVRQYTTTGEGEYFYCAAAGDQFYHLFDSPNYALQSSALTRATTAGGLPPDPNLTPWFQGAFFQFPILLAAIEPAQEDALVGLKTALHSGNYLTPPSCAYGNPTVRCEIPLILNTRTYVPFTLAMTWDRLDLPFDTATLARVQANGKAELESRASSTVRTWDLAGDAAYRQALETVERYPVNSLWQLPGALHYVGHAPLAGVAAPTLAAVPVGSSIDGGGLKVIAMRLFQSTRQVMYREPAAGMLGGDLPFKVLGTYDIERLAQQAEVNQVPLETYFPPRVTLRYDPNGVPLTPKPMHPTFSETGYILSPPLALTTLEATQILSFDPNRTARRPISAIRIRVAGVSEYSAEASARIEAVAAEIIDRTGLDVDVMVGSSPVATLVYLPGHKDVPASGYVEEGWVRMGVGYRISAEVNRVNELLFLVVLTISALHILNASLTSVLARTQEVALQKTLGWRRAAVAGAVLAEGLLVGVFAGAIGLLLAWSLARALQLAFPLTRALLVLPLGVALCLAGGLAPAVVASRVTPAALLARGEVVAQVRAHARFSLFGYATRQMLRRPMRAVLSLLAVTFSSGLLTLLLLAGLTTRGYLAGTLLGEYILDRIGPLQIAIGAVALFTAALTVADNLLMSMFERRREIGLLKALGWRSRPLAGLFLREALALVVLGSLAGWATATLAFARFAGRLTPSYLAALPVVLLLSLIAGALAALYPLRQAVSAPPASIMREA